MTSEEIQIRTEGNLWTPNRVQAEIAYQLAVMNEQRQATIYEKELIGDKIGYKRGWNEARAFIIEKILKPVQDRGYDGLKIAMENVRLENEREI
jgi:hypothetical protein